MRLAFDADYLNVLVADDPPAVRIPKEVVLDIDSYGLVVEIEILDVLGSAAQLGITMKPPVARIHGTQGELGYIYTPPVDAMAIPLVSDRSAHRPLRNRLAPALMLLSAGGEFCGIAVRLTGPERILWEQRLRA